MRRIMRTRVKICGFTRIDDAVYAAGLGVDAIGLVFYPPSPRHVDMIWRQHRPIFTAFVSVVALFVNAEPTLIQEVLQRVPVDCLQFHGEEPAAACRVYGKPYIKAVRMQADTRSTNWKSSIRTALAYCWMLITRKFRVVLVTFLTGT